MRVAPPVVIDSLQKKTLEQWARSRSLPARQVERAKVVLSAAEGKTDLEIAAALRIGNHKVARWRKRFLNLGLAGLEYDAPRRGRKRDAAPAPRRGDCRRGAATAPCPAPGRRNRRARRAPPPAAGGLTPSTPGPKRRS